MICPHKTVIDPQRLGFYFTIPPPSEQRKAGSTQLCRHKKTNKNGYGIGNDRYRYRSTIDRTSGNAELLRVNGRIAFTLFCYQGISADSSYTITQTNQSSLKSPSHVNIFLTGVARCPISTTHGGTLSVHEQAAPEHVVPLCQKWSHPEFLCQRKQKTQANTSANTSTSSAPTNLTSADSRNVLELSELHTYLRW